MTAPATQARPTRREIARAVIRASWLDGTFDAATVAIFASGRMTRAGVRRRPRPHPRPRQGGAEDGRWGVGQRGGHRVARR
jgi:hypothetical protein